jgi:hypothetical protein
MATLKIKEKEKTVIIPDLKNRVAELGIDYYPEVKFKVINLNGLRVSNEFSIEPLGYKGKKYDGLQILFYEGIYEVSEYQAGANQDQLWIYGEYKNLGNAIKSIGKGNSTTGRTPIKYWDNDKTNIGAKKFTKKQKLIPKTSNKMATATATRRAKKKTATPKKKLNLSIAKKATGTKKTTVKKKTVPKKKLTLSVAKKTTGKKKTTAKQVMLFLPKKLTPQLKKLGVTQALLNKVEKSGKGVTVKLSNFQSGGSNKEADIRKKALAPGKRLSAAGNVYYESRKNRSDKKGSRI